MDYSKFWISHSVDIMDKLVDVYQKINIPQKDIDKYQNINFDKILEIIGNHFADDSKNQIHISVYSIAYDRIVSIANNNNTKKGRFKYWVSKKQIKSLRKAYRKIYNVRRNSTTHFFVKVPYNTIYILNAVYEIALSINEAKDKLNGKILSQYLANDYIQLYLKELRYNPDLLDFDRARELHENILDGNQCANRIF